LFQDSDQLPVRSLDLVGTVFQDVNGGFIDANIDDSFNHPDRDNSDVLAFVLSDVVIRLARYLIK
jgi:hypothetical protein